MFIITVAAFSPNVSVYGSVGDSFLDEEIIEVSDTSRVLTRGNYLNYGTVLMSKVSSTRVLITGMTICHRTSDKVGVSLYLEQSTDGVHYGPYRQWNFWCENEDTYSVSLEVIVQPGYWYRLGGGHVAVMGSEGESVTTKTDGLYIG